MVILIRADCEYRLLVSTKNQACFYKILAFKFKNKNIESHFRTDVAIIEYFIDLNLSKTVTFLTNSLVTFT